MPASRSRRASTGPAPRLAPLVLAATVAATAAAAFFGFVPAVVCWAGVVVAAWMETPATLTGKKDSYGYPTPANPAEEARLASWRTWRQLRFGLVIPSGDWLPGWPPLGSWLAAVWVAVLAAWVPVRAFPHSGVSTGAERALDAAAAFVLVAAITAARRRAAGADHPGTRLDESLLGAVRAAPLPAALSLGAGGLAGALVGIGATRLEAAYQAYRRRWRPPRHTPIRHLVAHGAHSATPSLSKILGLSGRPLPGWDPTLPHHAFLVAVCALGGAGLAFGVIWSRHALSSWRELAGVRAAWEPRWLQLRFDPPPTLVSHRTVGPATVDVFDAPGHLGSAAFRPLAPKIAPSLGAGMRIAVVEQPDDGPSGPMPGTVHPVRFVVACWPTDLPDLAGPGLDAETVELLAHCAMVWALEPKGYGRPVPLAVEALSAPDSPRAVWASRWAWPVGPSLSEIRPLRSELAARFACPVLVDHRADVVYFGALDDAAGLGEVSWADSGSSEAWGQTFRGLATEDRWDTVWTSVLKSGANPPTPQLNTEATVVLADGTEVHRLAFMARRGIDPGDYRGLEPRLATALDAVPFVAVTGWPGAGARPGERHPQAVVVYWSESPVPTSPDRLTESPAAHWVLAGQINAAFDAARLARPEIAGARCLSEPGEPAIWEVELRLYGGVTLSDVRSSAERLRQSFGVPWLRASEGDDGVILHVGAEPASTTLAGGPETALGLASLDWDQAWIDSGVVTAAGLAPSLRQRSNLPHNAEVEVLDFELPPGLDRGRIRMAVPKLRAATGNEFVEPRDSPLGASAVRLLVCRVNPLPVMAPVDFDEIDRLSGQGVPFATGVEGEPVIFDPKDNPHVLLAGVTGSGKSSMAQVLLYGFASAGARIAVVDAVKAGADYRFVEPYADAWAATPVEAARALKAVYAEVVRRKDLNSAHGAGSYADLPEDVRPRPLVVMVDEFTSLIGQSPVPKPTEDPDVEAQRDEILADNQARLEVGMLAGKLAREARSAGVTLLLGTQKMSAKMLDSIPGASGGDLKTNLARSLLGKASSGDRMSALRAFDDAPVLTGDIPKGRGIWEPLTSTGVAIQCWYAPQSELAENLARRREPLAPEERLAIGEPTSPPAAASDQVVEVAEMAFDLDDLEPSPPSARQDDEAGAPPSEELVPVVAAPSEPLPAGSSTPRPPPGPDPWGTDLDWGTPDQPPGAPQAGDPASEMFPDLPKPVSVPPTDDPFA